MRTGPLDLETLDRAYVCVVKLGWEQRPVLYQVTLRPDKIHDGVIRLGETQGDEINGWQYPESLQVISVLGALNEKGECEPLSEQSNKA